MTTEEKTKMISDEQEKKDVIQQEPATESPADDVKVEDEPTVESKNSQKSEVVKKDKKAKSSDKNAEKETVETKEESESEKDENPLLVTFSVEVTHEKIENDFNEALIKYASEIKLPGFRQGKVPIDVIRSRFKDAITDEVVNKIVESAVFEKIEKDKLKIISRPEVLKVDFEEGKDLTADVQVEVFPTVDLPDFTTLEVEIPKDDLHTEPFDEAKQIDTILEGNRRQVPVVSREIKDHDYIMYKHQAKIMATKRMTPKKSDYFVVEEKTEAEIIDLYKEVVGKKIEETFTFTRTYPEDYRKKAWAGKEIEHYVTIDSIFELVKPELDDKFLKSIGFDDLESFKNKLKEEFEQHNTKVVEDKKMKLIVDKVSDEIQFPIPQMMVNQELSRMIQQQQMPSFDASDKGKMKEHMEKMKLDAERNIRFSFIMETIKEKHKLEADSNDLENEYKKIAEYNNAPVKDVRKFYMKKENAQNLKESIVKNKVMDFLKENVKIKEV